MLFYGCSYIGVSGPLIQYLKTMQPRCRITATMSQYNNELSTNIPFLEAGQGGECGRVKVCPGGGWGCGPEQLAATVPCASVYSGCMQWRGAHTAKNKTVFCTVLHRVL